MNQPVLLDPRLPPNGSTAKNQTAAAAAAAAAIEAALNEGKHTYANPNPSSCKLTVLYLLVGRCTLFRESPVSDDPSFPQIPCRTVL